MIRDREYTRRHIFVGLGTAGLGLGLLSALGAEEGRAFTHYTRVSSTSEQDSSQTEPSDKHGIRVAWWESYNGKVLETQADGSETNASKVLDDEVSPAFVPEVSGPVLSMENVLPGDEGIVGIGIEADVPRENQVAVWFRPVLVSTAENGVNEPESKHPDEDGPNDGGEVADLTRVAVWKNDGLAGIGANDDRLTPLAEEAIRDGSLKTVFSDSGLEDGLQLGCLGSSETTYLGLRWTLPASVGNVVQSDSATFGLQFRAARCDGENPFDRSTGESDD